MRSRPRRPDQDLLRQPTSRCRIDDPLSFWGRWFSNRRVSSVFRPSLTAPFDAGPVWMRSDAVIRSF
jgi:hypothetical protein